MVLLAFILESVSIQGSLLKSHVTRHATVELTLTPIPGGIGLGMSAATLPQQEQAQAQQQGLEVSVPCDVPGGAQPGGIAHDDILQMGHLLRRWDKTPITSQDLRWFVLTADRLLYYASSDGLDEHPQGVIPLQGLLIMRPDPNDPLVGQTPKFKLQCAREGGGDEQQLKLQAATMDEARVGSPR